MDPYLENPGLWPDVHHNLISEIQARLTAELRPKSIVRIEERAYITSDEEEWSRPQQRVSDVEVMARPGWEQTRLREGRGASSSEMPEPVVTMTWFEDEVREAFLKIIDRQSRDVVAVIELLSPANKVPNSPGRESFETKRREVMNSSSHWVEIDLLRGKRMVPVPRTVGPHQYLVHVSRRTLRPRGELWGIRLPQRLPIIPIPLKAGDPDARLDLQAVVDSTYDRAGYDMELDYRKEPKPRLDAKLAAWADQLLRSKGLRARRRKT
jgi:hypothetical protein